MTTQVRGVVSEKMKDNPNVLLLRLKSIGDILFTLPAVHSIRANLPTARISFLVSQEHAPLLEGFADVDEVIPLDRAGFRSYNPVKLAAKSHALLTDLRRGRFALTIDFQGYGETALLSWWTRAPQRWGVVYRTGRGWAYTRGVHRNDAIQPAQSHLDFLKACGLCDFGLRNQFILPQAALTKAHEFFRANQLAPAKPTLFIQPFTSSADKNWPLDKYLALAKAWRSRGVQVLFGGGPGDRKALEPACQMGFPVSAGVPLLVTGGLMKLSTLILGGDTGLVHLAVALEKRVLMIFSGSGNCHPFGHPEWTLVPAMGANVASIGPEIVHRAIAEALAV